MGERCLARIEQLSNGFELHIHDPKISEANRKSKGAYKDPWRVLAFKSTKELLKFLNANLDKAMPGEDEYDSAFTGLVKQKGEKDDD